MEKENEIDGLSLWLLVITIMLAGGWLRAFMLAKQGLWLDETFSLWLAAHSVPDMLQWIVRIDQHPPLYYLLLHTWIGLNGNAAYEVRLLSVLFGTATIPVIFLIGKRMSGVMLGLAAAVLLAVSPFNIRYAQETRMYTLLTFNAAAAVYALVRLLTDPSVTRPIGSQFREYLRAWRTPAPENPETDIYLIYQDKSRNRTGWRGWIFNHHYLPIQAVQTDLAWVALIVFSAATLYTHNTAILFLAAINIFVLGLILYQRIQKPGTLPSLQAPSLGNWVKAQVGILILWSPWIPVFLRQASEVDQGFWLAAPTWDTVLQTLRSLFNESLFELANLASQGSWIWILYALVLALGLVHYRRKISRLVFLAVLFAVPFLGELVLSLRRPIFSDRTLIWLTIPLILALAAGIAQLRFRIVMIAGIVVLGTINLFSDVDYYRYMQKENWADAAGFVGFSVQQGDLVLFNATWTQIPFDYYFRKYEDSWYLRIERHGVPVDLFDRGVLEPKMEESDIPRLKELVIGRKRVWLVYSHNWYTDPEGIVEKTLSAEMKLTKSYNFYGGQVMFFEAP